MTIYVQANYKPVIDSVTITLSAQEASTFLRRLQEWSSESILGQKLIAELKEVGVI